MTASENGDAHDEGGALAPHKCTRCRTLVTAADPARLEFLESHVFAPLNPRPEMSGKAVWWEVAADSERQGRVAAYLCSACVEDLLTWLYAGTVTR